MQSELHFRSRSCVATTGVMFAGSELAGNGSELDSEMSGNRWSPYSNNVFGERQIQPCKIPHKHNSAEQCLRSVASRDFSIKEE